MSKKKSKGTLSKQELKGRVDKTDMDLSLSELTVLPVREMLTYSRVTKLDLSCNLLEELPEEICEMRQLHKLDLSKNVLSFLPQSIGHLERLRELDLFSNRLSSLPLSFSQLTQLRWLDVKNNMLDTQLVEVAGTCVDARECEQCARSVVQFMRGKAAEAERIHQDNLQRERRAQEKEKRLVEQENAERRRQKQELKQRRREEREAELRHRVKEQGGLDASNGGQASWDASNESEDAETRGPNCFLWFLVLFFFVIAVTCGISSLYCMSNQDTCEQYANIVVAEGTRLYRTARQSLS